MFADYQKLVIEEYHRKRAANKIAFRLMEPTPGKLRDECLAVCEERFQRSDENILRTFFGQASDQKSYLKAIKNCHPDRFRPLGYFINGKTLATEEINVELLAWLIDFKKRPFELGGKYIADGVAVQPSVVGTEPGLEQQERLPATAIVREEKPALATTTGPSVKPSNYRRMKFGALLMIVLAITGISVFWPKTNSQQSFAINGLQSCMYWAGDHYQQVSCNQRMGSDTMVIALDTFKLRHLKKITQRDTITKNSIGSVWYSKIGNQLEFFTADGFHPVHPENRLRPITQYIISKYLEPVSSPK